MKLEDQLKKYRKMHGLTQNDIAEHLNISRQSISKWETGKSYPDIDNLLILSQLYKITINELLGEEHQNIENPHPVKNHSKQKNIKMNLNNSHVLFLISVISLFLFPIGVIIAILILIKNQKENELYRTINCICVVSIILSLTYIFIFLFL